MQDAVVTNQSNHIELEKIIDELGYVKEELSNLMRHKRELERQIIQHMNERNATKINTEKYKATVRFTTPTQKVKDYSTISRLIEEENKANGLTGTAKEIVIDDIGKVEVKVSLAKLKDMNARGYLQNLKEFIFEEPRQFVDLKKV